MASRTRLGIILITIIAMQLLFVTAIHAAGPVHVVQRGETLSGIAAQYNITYMALKEANSLRNASLIYVGQRLLIPSAEQAAVMAQVNQSTTTVTRAQPGDGRWIDISIATQTMLVYQGQTVIRTFTVSTGQPSMPTVRGRFQIYGKALSQTMAGPGYIQPDVPYVMYFSGAYAIHGSYWHNEFGRAISHGCVNLLPWDAAWLYNWAALGTPVIVH
ncbi:MAG: LysM peptidoglycan-binding domain-containing protein [Chloroflexi bacterium]|nr:LysM peptidoglycan-binding domain-containing protein [Chloroflexota bacterium]